MLHLAQAKYCAKIMIVKLPMQRVQPTYVEPLWKRKIMKSNNREFWLEIRKEVARMYQSNVTNEESKL